MSRLFGAVSAAALISALPALAAPAAPAPAEAAVVTAEEPQSDVTLSEIVVIARDRVEEIPGAVTVLDREDYARSQPFSVNDVLRRVPGLYPRSEDGLGLRPNIGFRGLNPTRSTEVLLLEDGIPLTYAPYGDNASYYHPPLERFAGVEVLRGSGQIVFGPHTVGGVVNYLTPRPPEDFEGRLLARIGTRDTQELSIQAGDTVGRLGLFGALSVRHAGDLRENTDLNTADLFLKGVWRIDERQELAVRLNTYGEDSQVSYSGLTQAEYEADPRGNPFRNDRFEIDRHGASLTHGVRLSEATTLTTALYGATFQRDWWRQSSNSAQRPADRSDPRCGSMANVNSTCGNEGRLRQYDMLGLESRLATRFTLGGLPNRLQFGARLHGENQERFQWNGDLPNSRAPGTSVNGGVREHGVREARAASAFVEDAVRFGTLTVTGGLRYETIAYDRSDKLAGRIGSSSLDALIPGIGFAWEVEPRWTVFGGVHRGFSPPRVEDLLTAAGGSVDLDAEQSVNLELGVRGRPAPGVRLEATLFRMDFDNQIVPASVAGGVGATSTSAGETLHQGFEAAARFSSRDALGTETDWYADGALTWVGTAEFRGRRFSGVSGFGGTSVEGNRLPYAPEVIARAAVGFETAGGLQAEIEAQFTGEMFGDDLNTVAPTADGQRGLIGDAVQINLAASWRVPNASARLLLNVRNLADETFIVDRSRGVLVNEPRIVQGGIEVAF